MVTILMAAYNGERYISEQIESILQQTYTDWKLIIQDDCSTDKTVSILLKYQQKYPQKIKLIERKEPSGSAKHNFFSMFKYANSDYVMTCDQDDIWLPDKIQITQKEMHRLEAVHGIKKAILVHTDLKVVDSDLNEIEESLFKRQKLDNRKDKVHNLLVQNIVTGCTMLVNRALLNKVNDLPKDVIMHDWWLAIIASAFGAIGFVNQSTVLYRQHGSNEVGSKNIRSVWYNLGRFLDPISSKQSLRSTYRQAQSFLEMYGEMLTPECMELVREYSSIPLYGKVRRIETIFRYGFWKASFIRRCGQILFC
ncbi:putative glycosyltransferase EpsE [Desulfosporosinus acididurans]|uniref:Putative glycosyltransferase EpsE n=1 Tax=Desulfosporosinus acididurans TaxID=476652 RepID=A0A0J1FN30_9FIRM|nr:glycosyltransferase family 2 protein [Desulfosporosinus acididurans]KLU64368.1 putative glycosyltransferase EpsE [Desulfosporosinus acididurans]